MATATMLYQREWSLAGLHGMKDCGLWIPAISPFALWSISCIVTSHYTWDLLFSRGGSPGSGS